MQILIQGFKQLSAYIKISNMLICRLTLDDFSCSHEIS